MVPLSLDTNMLLDIKGKGKLHMVELKIDKSKCIFVSRDITIKEYAYLENRYIQIVALKNVLTTFDEIQSLQRLIDLPPTSLISPIHMSSPNVLLPTQV